MATETGTPLQSPSAGPEVSNNNSTTTPEKKKDKKKKSKEGKKSKKKDDKDKDESSKQGEGVQEETGNNNVVDAASPSKKGLRTRASSGASTSLASLGDGCLVCGKVVYFSDRVKADDKVFHKACFRCTQCKGVLKLGSYAGLEGKYYCKPHFKQLFQLKGNYAGGFGTETPKERWERGKSAQDVTEEVRSDKRKALEEVVEAEKQQRQAKKENEKALAQTRKEQEDELLKKRREEMKMKRVEEEVQKVLPGSGTVGRALAKNISFRSKLLMFKADTADPNQREKFVEIQKKGSKQNNANNNNKPEPEEQTTPQKEEEVVKLVQLVAEIENQEKNEEEERKAEEELKRLQEESKKKAEEENTRRKKEAEELRKQKEQVDKQEEELRKKKEILVKEIMEEEKTNIENMLKAEVEEMLNDTPHESTTEDDETEDDLLQPIHTNNTPQVVEAMMKKLGLEKYVEKLKSEEVDVEAMKKMRSSEWKELGIPLGPRVKIARELSSGKGGTTTITEGDLETKNEELTNKMRILCSLILDDNAHRDELKKEAEKMKRELFLNY